MPTDTSLPVPAPAPAPVTVRRTYKYRLYPTHQQMGQLDHAIHLCRQLYNSALQERREAYLMAGISLNYYDQANQLKECKADECRPDLKDVHSQVLQDVLKRAQRAFDAFFRRVREGTNRATLATRVGDGTTPSPTRSMATAGG